MLQTLPKSAQKIIDHYFNLQIGGKKVTCLYYINEAYDEEFRKKNPVPDDIDRYHKRKTKKRAYIGKGSPKEIERTVIELAKQYSFNLQRATSKEIRQFMYVHRIGIDCSGFVVWVLNEVVKELQKKPVWKVIRSAGQFRGKLRMFLRPIENISVKVLDNRKNSVVVSLREIQPGDLIISLHGKHVLLIESVTINSNLLTDFSYVQSTWWYGDGNGVRRGKVKIKEIGGELKDQEWVEDFDKKGENWTYQGIKAGSWIIRLNKM